MANKVLPELYKEALINDLVLFCLFSRGKESSFEQIVKQCFGDFPKAFCLSKIKKWPDSRKVDKSLRRLEKKKLIKGNIKDGFSLTSLGRKKAEEAAKVFRQERLI